MLILSGPKICDSQTIFFYNDYFMSSGTNMKIILCKSLFGINSMIQNLELIKGFRLAEIAGKGNGTKYLI